MSPYVSKIIKKYGLEEQKAEFIWKQFKDQFCIKEHIKESDLQAKQFNIIFEYAEKYIEKIILVDISSFVNSDKNAKEFIEELTSSNFSIDVPTIPPKEKQPSDVSLEDNSETKVSTDNMTVSPEPEEGKEIALESVEIIDKFIDADMKKR